MAGWRGGRDQGCGDEEASGGAAWHAGTITQSADARSCPQSLPDAHRESVLWTKAPGIACLHVTRHRRIATHTGLARFVLVARTPDRTAAADVPVLLPQTPRERELFEQGQVGAGA